MALNVFFEPETDIVHKAFLAFGGMAPTTVLARKTCETMVGRYFVYLYNCVNGNNRKLHTFTYHKTVSGNGTKPF